VRLALGTALGLTVLACSASAEAAQRYAAPNGTGTACTREAPCTLADSINEASNGDEVIITAGDYQITGAPINVVNKLLRIHGDFGGPMPRISAALGGLPAINVGGSAEGSSISYVEVVNQETEAVAIRCSESIRVERVRATGVGEGATGVRQVESCLVSDSLVRGEGTNSLGIESLGSAPNDPAGTARNVTAIATGENSVAIQSRYNYINPGTRTLILVNSIARGGRFDLRAEDDSIGDARIEVSNSNFDTVSAEGAASISGPANQTAPPSFVDAAAGDYREAPGSPTIDAGSAAGIGLLDLAGSPRLLGSAPDIGAYEFTPPPSPVVALTSLTVSPKAFRARSAGEAIVSKVRRGKRGGATVRYALTAAASVSFTVERALRGRRVGGKCRRQTAANRGRKRCTRFKAMKSAFSLQGLAGGNAFKFSGRLRGRALRPGRYRLVGRAGASVRFAAFSISG
jgi:hypothetical protein